MNRRQWGWVLAMVVLTLLVTASAPAFPQEPGNDEAAPSVAEPMGAEAVETILRQQESLLRGQHFTYDPGGRRDPFRSLYERLSASDDGPRAPGIRGMAVMEIDLVGIVKDARGGDVGLVIGSDNKGYFMRVGDVVHDGTVIGVDPRLGTVTFRQKNDDPMMIKPFRDVVKRLVPQTNEESDE